jgi:hypothetical protein
VHDLFALLADVADPVTGLDELLLRTMPSELCIIEMRAGEGSEVGVREAYRLYRTALTLSEQCTAAMPQEIVARNVAFHIKRPPWALLRIKRDSPQKVHLQRCT